MPKNVSDNFRISTALQKILVKEKFVEKCKGHLDKCLKDPVPLWLCQTSEFWFTQRLKATRGVYHCNSDSNCSKNLIFLPATDPSLSFWNWFICLVIRFFAYRMTSNSFIKNSGNNGLLSCRICWGSIHFAINDIKFFFKCIVIIQVNTLMKM